MSRLLAGYYAPRVIVDIAEMPGFNINALTTDEAREQTRSVTRDRAYCGVPHPYHGGLSTVCCREHGAMLCVAKNESGRIWRCPACNEGAFEPNG
jgi:hypothetical protein